MTATMLDSEAAATGVKPPAFLFPGIPVPLLPLFPAPLLSVSLPGAAFECSTGNAIY